MLANLLNDIGHNQTNFLVSNTLILSIAQPLRIISHCNTLIDISDIILDNLIATIFNHLSQFAIIPNMFGNNRSSKSDMYL